MNGSMELVKKRMYFWWQLAVISLGCLFYAAGVSLFLDPLKIAPGGLSGISIVLNELIPLETGTILLLLNVPLLLLGLKKFGKAFLLNTVYATVLSSVLMDLITWLVEPLPLITEQELLASIAGSACTALGIGLVFRCGCTTGGTDILVKVLRTKYPHIKSGTLAVCVDVMVVALAALVYRDLEKAIIATVGIIIYGVVLDQVLYRRDEATMMLIVSERHQQIAQRILLEVGIGATLLQATGAYTGLNREIVLCVAHKRLYPKVREIVREEDKDAFTIITSASTVYGEGFKDPFATEI